MQKYYERYYQYIAKQATNVRDFQEYFGYHVLLVLCLVSHCIYLVYFTIEAVPIMIGFNVVSCITYIITLFLIKYGRFFLACIVMNLEIVAFTILGNTMYGGGSNFSVVLLVLMVANVLVFNNKQRFTLGVSAFLIVLYIICYASNSVIPNLAPPLDGIPVLNAIVFSSALCLELLIVFYAKKLSDRFHLEKMDVLEQETFIDPLTGLHNRRYAQRYFERTVAANKATYPITFALLDIDHFKVINDTYGHEFGDTVLQGLSRLLKQSYRASDLVCRWGGEEFLIVLLNVAQADAFNLFDTLRKDISELTFKHGDEELHISVTIGATQHLDEDIATTIALCDENLYYGKTNGRNMVHVL